MIFLSNSELVKKIPFFEAAFAIIVLYSFTTFPSILRSINEENYIAAIGTIVLIFMLDILCIYGIFSRKNLYDSMYNNSKPSVSSPTTKDKKAILEEIKKAFEGKIR